LHRLLLGIYRDIIQIQRNPNDIIDSNKLCQILFQYRASKSHSNRPIHSIQILMQNPSENGLTISLTGINLRKVSINITSLKI